MHGDKTSYTAQQKVLLLERENGLVIGTSTTTITYMRLSDDKELGVYSFIIRARKVLLHKIIF
jgi:predicted hotdog family 3-hydroxylacyl-ACP dehydratase